MKPRHLWKQPKRSPLKPRTTWLQRGMQSLPIPKSRPRPKKKRTAAEERAKHEREYGPPGRAEFVKALPSVASGKRPCVNAHVGNKGAGTSRKADYDQIVPLTDSEHREELHQMGRESFEAMYEISLDDEMVKTEQLWQAHLAAVEGARG